MSTEQRTINVYWTMQRGKRFTISMSEETARASLLHYFRYEDDPVGWTVERTTETVPVVLDERFVADGELIDLETRQTSRSSKSYLVESLLDFNCSRCVHEASHDD